MVFNSVSFLIFFPIVVGLYFVLPKKARAAWLLVTSYYFYMSWNALYAILILFSTFITYLAGILLGKSKSEKGKKWVVAGSLIINLGILFFFKYFDFALDNLNAVFNLINVKIISNPFDILLPVGISFYTFQALGYTIDVYRGEVPAEKNFIRYALFVSFFPQLVAGPIERSKNLLSQVERLNKERLFSYEKVVSGFSMMCWGMFLKMVLADNIAIFVDSVWDNLQMAGSTATIFAAVAFSLQIYCDFGGYSTIAIGAARVMGFDLMENFNTPYFATSIADFWRRWHISLSSWFRDYVYIPLGGNRCSKVRHYINIMITFLVSGLWHGADWTYVIWGGIHGAYQVIGKLLMPVREKLTKFFKVNIRTTSYHLGQIVVTFALTTFAWIFFRADSLSEAKLFIKHLLTKPDPWNLFNGSLYDFGVDTTDFHVIVVAIFALVLADIIRYRRKCDIGAFLYGQNLWFRWLVLIVLIVACLVYGAYGINFDSAQFIYFQF